MTLTGEQVTAIKDGTPVTLTPAEVGEPCVVLRADVYARLKTVLEDDDDHPLDGTVGIHELMQEDDARDPWLEGYQRT
ncbi:MAG: hypothetical protein Q8K78_10370 [Planctomycetaceae bacterium]|nr:hypothetical protein [Planctomycetaceae bacterium]